MNDGDGGSIFASVATGTGGAVTMASLAQDCLALLPAESVSVTLMAGGREEAASASSSSMGTAAQDMEFTPAVRDGRGTELMEQRESWLAEVFVELSDTLTTEFDLIEFLARLSERCAELLRGPQVGVMLSDARGRLRHIASSTEDMRVIELLELQHDEGPCLDCFHSASAVLNQPLDTAIERWPDFAPGALAAGFRVVTALPLRLRDDVIGAMNIFHVDDDPIEPLDVRLAQALADIATVGILQQRAISDSTVLATQLQTALNQRIVIEQAKGMVGAALAVSVDQAFVLLRSYARSRNERLVDVSVQLLDRSLPATELRSAADRPTSERARRTP